MGLIASLPCFYQRRSDKNGFDTGLKFVLRNIRQG
jgi:hypothetical protein